VGSWDRGLAGCGLAAGYGGRTFGHPMGATEVIFIFAVYLLLFGAKGIPSLARSMGQAVRTFRNATEDIQREILADDRNPRGSGRGTQAGQERADVSNVREVRGEGREGARHGGEGRGGAGHGSERPEREGRGAAGRETPDARNAHTPAMGDGPMPSDARPAGRDGNPHAADA
jgi:sec-independent protein translocase protein TatA